MSAGNHCLKRGPVEVKCASSIFVDRYKKREMILHSSMLSYFQADVNQPEGAGPACDRPLDPKRDFLLPPLGHTEIIQMGNDLLKIIVKRKDGDDNDAPLVSPVEATVLQKLTLKFRSRAERDEWIEAIIAECEKNYLERLIDITQFGDGEFARAAHNEIWSAILFGDEPLRKAYIAPAGSDQFAFVRMLLESAVSFLPALLGVERLDVPHAKVLAAVFSLMLHDSAARALLLLMRPNESFLMDYKGDNRECVYTGATITDPCEIVAWEKCAAALSFVQYVKKRLQSPSWKQYRSFLAIIDHPAMPPHADATAAYFEKQTAPGEELAWATRCKSELTSEVTWAMMHSALSDTPYLSYHFIMRSIGDVTDGKRLRRGLALLDRVPEAHQNCAFAAESVGQHLRTRVQGRPLGAADVGLLEVKPHFKQLRVFALFSEIWKVVMSRVPAPSVMHAVWLLLESNTCPALSGLFLPETVDAQSQKLTYGSALQRHAIITIAGDGTFPLPRLYPTLGTIPQELKASPKDISAHDLLVDRITKWVHSLLGGRQHHLEESDAALFMEIFAASAADVAMRAFLVTFVPAPSLVTEFMRSARYAQLPLSVHEVDEATALCSAAVKFIKMLAQTFRRDKWQQYRSFVNVLQHPTLYAGEGRETDPAWSEESQWILSSSHIKSAMISWQEVEYVMTETPYIFLLLVTKALPTVEQQKAAMMRLPSKYLVHKHNSSTGCAPGFVGLCLDEGGCDWAMEVFQELDLVNDAFVEALLAEAVMDSTCPRLLQAFRLLQKFLYADSPTPFYRNGDIWDVEVLRKIPNIAPVLVTFLWDISQRPNFRRDEKIIGNLILLIFQLESCSSDGSVTNASTLANERVRRDDKFANMLFEMVEALNFPKWFSRLCWNFNVHFGKIVEVVPEPELAMDSVYTEPSEQAAAPAPAAAAVDDHNGDVMLDPTIPLTKHKLTMSILGFFNLCLEFKPQVLCDFVAGLGTGRPFFSFFLHQKEALGEQVLLSLTNILNIKPGTLLYARLQQRFLFYDNDHLSPAAVKTLGLRTSKVASSCLNLTDSEFTDLLTVAMYTHDLRDLDVRFANVVISMVADQERREMVVKFMQWVLEYFITPDITRESNPLNTKANERCKWKHCEKFNNTTFEDIIECAAEATISSHLLRGAARSNSYNTLERLFQKYICRHEPSQWKDLFRGSKTIAYFIKYVDGEDLTLAFTKFYEMNPGNHCFMHHLLKVRRMLTQPIVSAQDLIALTASSTSFDDNNAERFFEQLRLKARSLPKEQGDLKMVYLLTASCMKISKEKVLFSLPPRNAQIITFLTVASWAKSLLGPKKDMRMGKALIAQVGTGEGKSLIIAMIAIYFVVVLKKRVHILENNPGLLDKDVETMKPLFAEFGILTQHEGTGADLKPRLSWTSTEKQGTKDCRREFAKVGVTYCLRRNLELFYQDSIMAEDFHPFANTVLIVDEVDDLIVDEKPNQPYAAKDCEQADFQAACREAQVESDRAAQDGGELNIADFANGDFVRETAANAYLMAKEMVLDQHYAVVGGKYVILQDGKPVEVYDYTLECLKFIKHGIPPAFSSTYYVQSVPYLLSQYDCITGFSSSLGSPSERAFLAQQYKAWSFDTPSFLNTCTNVYKVPPALMDDKVLYPGVPCVHVYDTVDQQMNKIVDICLQLHLKVPVLVIAKSPEEALVIEEKVKAALAAQALITPPTTGSVNKYVQLLRQYKQGTMTLDKANWGHIVRRATSQGLEDERFCITITDPFGGRGHDFDVHDDEVNRLGGLAVIMTSIPASEREWRQWKGRTARKDNRGQYAVVLCAESSPVSTAKEMLVDYALRSANHDAIPNLYQEQLIDKLLSVQDANQLAKLRVLETEILIGKRLNRLCDMFYETFGAMSVGTWPKSDEEVKLRYLLTDSCIIGPAVTKAFTDFDLAEHDVTAPFIAVPNTRNPSFWSEEDAAEWNARNAAPDDEQEEEIQLDDFTFDFRYQRPPPPPADAGCPSDLTGELDDDLVVSDDATAAPVPPDNPARRVPNAKLEIPSRSATTTKPTDVTRTLSKSENLVRSAAFAREVSVLDTLSVGETIRTTNLMGASLQELLSTVVDGDAVAVSVHDIDGSNAGITVVGLEAAGAITTTATAYTLILEVKAMSEDYQYNMSMYGKKRLEAKWKDVTLLSAPVLLLPASKLRPRAALAFHDATTDRSIPAGGHVLISSRDDPRSTPERPLFPPIKVPYTCGNIQLPPNLPDCIISVTPDITGYSNEYSEKFILFGGDVVPAVHRMLLSANDLSGGEWRVVLTWDEHPRDLDLYCLTDFNPRRVFFGEKNAGGRRDPSKGNIELDIDVRNGFGPETITFTPNATKKYRFLVHNFTGNGEASLASSGAKIVVYIGGGRPIQFEVPTDLVVDDSGRVATFWHVFDLFECVVAPVNEVTVTELRDVPIGAKKISDAQIPPPRPPVYHPKLHHNIGPVISPVPLNDGRTETSEAKAASLVRVAQYVSEMPVLDVLCVGDTVRLTIQFTADMKEKLFAVSSGGDPLTVAVYDIAGPNTGKGVAGLEVSGAITVTKQTYTMVFEVKVTPEDYQYNMLLYGKKRLEAKWKDVTVLSTEVLVKPTPKLRPRAALTLHNAVDDRQVAAGTVGTVLISSHDDPRSTPERPLFPAFRVAYTGGNIELPPNLPDCIISVTPDITGYSNEYSEKFVMFNSEISTEVQKMMLSASDLSGGEWRVVLTWGEHPQDLDFYCITNFEPRRIYFGAKNEGGRHSASKGNIELDIDVRNGFGPETITFTPDATKRYRFLVHNYTGNARMSIAGSGAKIIVNKGGRPAQFEVPTDIVLDDSGGFALFWHVFDLVNGAIVQVNQVIKEDLRNVPL